MTRKLQSCWVITDGKAGMTSQALGLAEALNIPITVKQCSYRLPWSLFPAYCGLTAPRFMTDDSDDLSPPWPDVLITCGRQALGASLYIKKQSHGQSFTICLQDPRISFRHFDLVIPMEHDHVTGSNIIVSQMALHRVTPQKLAEGKKLHQDLFRDHDKPYLAVLLGGSAHNYQMNNAAYLDIIRQLQLIMANSQGTCFVTPSRRTPNELMQMLGIAFSNNKRMVIIDPSQNNPYFGMLAMADVIFVTNDSVSMVSEACATGKKVYILPMLGHGSSKGKSFAQNLAGKKIVTMYEREVVAGDSKSFNETLAIAAQVKTILNARTS